MYCLKSKPKQLQWQVFTRMIDGSFDSLVIQSDPANLIKEQKIMNYINICIYVNDIPSLSILLYI